VTSGSAPAPISACIITRDEEDRLGPCLDALAWCDEVLVVDSHSSDATRALAAARGARVIERDWPGHIAQKEFAIREAKHDWVLCVDADERVTPELRDAIEAARAGGFAGAAGYEVSRVSRYLGRWIRHGTWYPDWKLRLFDRRRGGWRGRNPHDRVHVDGAVRRLAGELQHDPYRSFEDHLRTIDAYTTIMADAMRAEGRRARWLDVVTRPPARFLVFYVLRGGFLDGWRGLLLAYLAAHYVRLKYAKLWIATRT
jgi:glycosyltransferase involved in cell wall biosynthesis